MDIRLFEHIANENSELKEKLNKVSEEIETLKVGNETIVDENSHLKGEIEKKNETLKVVEAYTVLGAVEEITEKLETAKATNESLEKFVEISDSPEELEKSIKEAMTTISDFKNDFGTYEEVKSSLEEAITMKESIVEFGGLEEIKSVFEIAETLCNEKDEKELADKITKLATDTKLSEEKVKELLGKYDESDIRDLYNTVSETKIVEEETKTTVKVTEEVETPFFNKSRAERISERFQSM
jgi:FtsZ-binding cell division protein ZapB